MGIKVEYNDVLALRESDNSNLELRETQCLSRLLHHGSTHDYLKLGYRVFPLRKTIPLVVTKGDQIFTRVPALISIWSINVDSDPFDKTDIHTFGKYTVVNLLNKEQSDMWLKILQDPQNI